MAAVVAALLEALDSLDSRITAERLTIAEAFDWSIGVNRMRNMLQAWRAGHDQPVTAANVVTIYEMLGRCAEEPTPRVLPQLRFVRDPRLRKSIARDVESLDVLIRDQQWKAATVMGGAVVEALLLDRLLSGRNAARAKAVEDAHVRAGAATRRRHGDMHWKTQPFDRWDLWKLIAVAWELKLIDDTVVHVCEGVRDFRNLIHAGRERAKAPCDKGTAKAAEAAVENLIATFSASRR
jgi:hypothetical protein